jgi:hypothetical protein
MTTIDIDASKFESLKIGHGVLLEKLLFEKEIYVFEKISKRGFRVVYRGGKPDILWKFYLGEIVYMNSMKFDSISFDIKFLTRKELKVWETMGLLK